MATLLTESDFRDEVNVPGTERPEVCAELSRFITRYEPRFMREVLGAAFASEVYIQAAALDAGSGMAQYETLLLGGEWTDSITGTAIARFTEGLKFCLVRYVYFHFLPTLGRIVTPSGVRAPSTDNGTALSPHEEQAKAWNQMSRELDNVWHLLRSYKISNTSAYPLFNNTLPAYWNYRPITSEGF